MIMIDGGCTEAWCWEERAIGFSDLIVAWRLFVVLWERLSQL